MEEKVNRKLWQSKLESIQEVEAVSLWFEAKRAKQFSKNPGILVMVNIKSMVENITVVEKGKLCETVSEFCVQGTEGSHYMFKMLYTRNSKDCIKLFELLKSIYIDLI